MQQDDGISFVDGKDNFPAYKFDPNSNSKSPYSLNLPDKLTDFALMAVIKPFAPAGGYIFSVTNSMDSVIQFGLQLTPVNATANKIAILYNLHDSQETKELVSFFLPNITNKWTTIAFNVSGDEVSFFFNCVERERVTIKRDLYELKFDSSSTFYLAQGGPLFGNHFVVSTIFIFKIFINFYFFWLMFNVLLTQVEMTWKKMEEIYEMML